MRVILDRYELVAPIASGGMGTLWEGADRRLNRKIVVKLIRPGKRRDSAAMRRFNREARITARLGHPGVPVLYDFGTDQGELFMVIEQVSGVTIADLIAEVVPVPVPWAAAIVAQVCAVLAAAHEQQLIHLDLKPSNVMIRPDGSVKVLDFGLAAALAPGEFSQITRAGELPGTASYMAPEIAAGDQAEPASDLYSLGCLFYELLTGTTVFEYSDPVAEIEAHLSRQPAPVRSSRSAAVRSPNDARRVRAALVTVLRRAADDGDSLLAEQEALDRSPNSTSSDRSRSTTTGSPAMPTSLRAGSRT
jgi:serine/threonine protein kinase